MLLTVLQRWLWAGAVCVAAVALVVPLSAEQLDYEEVFARTARLEGRPYQVGRRFLEGQGRAILPFLKARAGSGDWPERDLARALVLRIERPHEVAVWLRTLSYWDHKCTYQPDGTVLIEFDPREAQEASKLGKKPPPMDDVVVTAEAVPIILGFLYESDRVSQESEIRSWTRAIRMLGHLAAGESAAGLLHLYGRSRRHDSAIEDALVVIGVPAVVVLREAVRTCPSEWSEGGGRADQEIRARNEPGITTSIAAARALGRIGDAESAGVLIDKLTAATHVDQVVAFAQALGRLQAPDGVEVVFSHLLRASGSYASSRNYPVLREAMRALAESARGFLESRLREDSSARARAVAGGLLFELDHAEQAAAFYGSYEPKSWPKTGSSPSNSEVSKDRNEAVVQGRSRYWQCRWSPGGFGSRPAPFALLAERTATSSWWVGKWTELARHKNEALTFDLLAELMLTGKSSVELALTLAELGDERAVEVYREYLERHEQRHRGDVRVLIEAILLLGSGKAVPVLETIIDRAAKEADAGAEYWKRSAELAAAVLPALQGDPEHMVKLLETKDIGVRRAAARNLAHRGDLRVFPVLVAEAMAAYRQQETDFGRSVRQAWLRREGHAAWRDAIVGLGPPAIALLKQRRAAAADWRERLFCEAVGLRISDPKLVEKFNRAADIRTPGFMKRSMPRMGDYQAAGRVVAEALGPEAIPLLEAAVAFRADGLQPAIAVFALAEFRQERSIEVLSKSFAMVHLVGASNPVAVALQAFGPKGIEAAKDVPVPDPEKDLFDRRAQRHRGATEALALGKEVKGVDGILAGLQVPESQDLKDGYSWERRIEIYLELAGNYHDQRLVDPVIGILNGKRERFWPAALDILAGYDDERIIPLCMKRLGKGGGEPTPRAALRALVKQLGDGLRAFLLRTLSDSPDPHLRAVAARALGDLICLGERYWEVIYKDPNKQREAVLATGRVAVDPLTRALADDDQMVQAAAAVALAKATGVPDHGLGERAIARHLTDWIRSQRNPPGAVINYLASSRKHNAAPAILAAYRLSDRRNTRLATALGKLEYREALPDVTLGLDAHLGQGERGYGPAARELEALGRLGPDGVEKVYEVFSSTPALAVRVQAAVVLGTRRYRKAFPEVSETLEQLITNGLQDARLTARKQHLRVREYNGFVIRLAGALASLDAQRGYQVISRALFRVDDNELVHSLSWQLRRLEKDHPDLKRVPVSLPG